MCIRDSYEIVTAEMRAMREATTKAPGVVGVRNSGGGFGGCLVAFVKATQRDEFIAQATSSYERTTNIKPQIFCVEGADGAQVLPA